MKDTELKVDCKDISLGMYVTKIDRPWLESPFLLQGFMINTEKDKQLLMQHCEYCYVDVERSKVIITKFSRNEHVTQKSGKFTNNPNNNPVIPYKRKRFIRDSTEMKTELDDVRSSQKKMKTAIKEMLHSLKLKQKLDLTATKEAIKPMVESIIRNPDAVLWLTRLRHLDEYSYSHSLGCSVWAMAMGRQLGLPKKDIESLGIGGLLFDIGKTRVPEKILHKKELLSEKDINIIRSHVQHTLDIIDAENKVNFKIRDMIEFHHERFDGSGYPHGLKNENIPLFAKIAAIVDCYDAITTKRIYAAEPLSSQEAVKKLYEWRGKDFQAELVEEFIQAIGMFPSGTLVELSTGEVAVVVTESRTRRLRPKIMLILNADKSMREDYIICNMMHEKHDSDGKSLDIKRALPPGSYNIQADDFYL